MQSAYFSTDNYMTFYLEHDGRAMEGTIDVRRRHYRWVSKCPVHGCTNGLIKSSTHPMHRLALMEHLKEHEVKGDF